MKYEGMISVLRELANSASGSNVNMPMMLNDAADAIEELQKENLRLHAFNDMNLEAREMLHERIKELIDTNVRKWIPVSERLPKVRQKVLFSYRDYITNQPRIFIGWYNGKQWDSLFATEYDVTHWMPLPEPPKDGET